MGNCIGFNYMGTYMKLDKIPTIRYMIQGGESRKRFDLLLSLTSIRSEPIIAALIDYYVKGLNQSAALALNEVRRDKFDRADKILQNAAGRYEALKALDWETRLKKPRKKRVDPLSTVTGSVSTE